MSYKMGLILSLTFVIQLFVFACDMISIQLIHSNLDAKAVTIGYLIANRGNLDDLFIADIENRYNITFACESNCTPRFGDVVEYTISTIYDPLIISNDPMIVCVRRSTVVGYYQ